MSSISSTIGLIHLAIIGISLTIPVLFIGFFLLQDPSDLFRKIKDDFKKKN